MSETNEKMQCVRFEETLDLFTKWMQAEYDAVHANGKLLAAFAGRYQALLEGMGSHIDHTIQFVEIARAEAMNKAPVATIKGEDIPATDIQCGPSARKAELERADG